MPTAEHSINGLQFLCLKGEVFLRQEELETFNRGGVDGTAFRKLGKRGQPFELISIVDAPSLEDAKAGFEAYRDIVATNPVTVIKDGINWGNYVVLRVSLAPKGIKAVANFAGGLNAPSLALLTCRWELHG
jgi:hypothetical protein